MSKEDEHGDFRPPCDMSLGAEPTRAGYQRQLDSLRDKVSGAKSGMFGDIDKDARVAPAFEFQNDCTWRIDDFVTQEEERVGSLVGFDDFTAGVHERDDTQVNGEETLTASEESMPSSHNLESGLDIDEEKQALRSEHRAEGLR